MATVLCAVASYKRRTAVDNDRTIKYYLILVGVVVGCVFLSDAYGRYLKNKTETLQLQLKIEQLRAGVTNAPVITKVPSCK